MTGMYHPQPFFLRAEQRMRRPPGQAFLKQSHPPQ